jgi:hypothetical protein
MGSSAQTVLKHYGHMFDEARLQTAKPMVDAITEARAAMECGRVVDVQATVTVLRGRRSRSENPYAKRD